MVSIQFLLCARLGFVNRVLTIWVKPDYLFLHWENESRQRKEMIFCRIADKWWSRVGRTVLSDSKVCPPALLPYRGMHRACQQQVLHVRCPFQQEQLGDGWRSTRLLYDMPAPAIREFHNKKLTYKKSEITEQLLVNWRLGLELEFRARA